MKVTLVRSGGLAGMVTTTSGDAADAPDDAAESLRRTVAACSFAEPEPVDEAVRDGFAYEVTVTVTGDDGTRRVRFGHGRAPAGIDALVRGVDDSPHGSREVGR
jgi:hypothetical protein